MRFRNRNGVNQAGDGFSLQGPILVGELSTLSAVLTVLGADHGLILPHLCPLCEGRLATVSPLPYSALERHLKNT